MNHRFADAPLSRSAYKTLWLGGYADKNLKNLAGAVEALPLVCSIVWLLVSQLPSAPRYYPPAFRQ